MGAGKDHKEEHIRIKAFPLRDFVTLCETGLFAILSFLGSFIIHPSRLAFCVVLLTHK
jgi:hypothetical protein